jgi:CRP-like cAMP-binding protein
MGAEPQLFERFGREFPAGTVLFREGEPGREMYVIQEGKVNISKRAGEIEKLLSALGPGEFFGEMSILSGAPRSATATCAEDSRLLVIDARTFESMVRGSAEIAVRLIKKLAERLRDADHQIANLLLRDAESRVVHYLAVAAEKGSRSAVGVKIDVSARELPARVGIPPEQAEEVLLGLLKSQIVSVYPDAMVVPDPARLRQHLEALQARNRSGERS